MMFECGSPAGGVGFSDNFILWREAGYFDRASDLKPLMHLWSLGIEEQFYLPFPVLLKLAGESGARYISPTALLCDVEGCLVRPDNDEFAHAVMALDDAHLTPEGAGYFIAMLKKERLLDATKSGVQSR
jgi:hypothetical protein